MKVLMVGDVHMDLYNILNCIELAASLNCEKILAVGDFGYWTHTAKGRKFISELSKHAKQFGVLVHFIKGNHDNHDYLGAYANGSITEVAPNLYFHQNLSQWTWGEYSFIALGGAFSVDGYKRIYGVSKWHNEELSYAEVYACDGLSADIVISHDCPDSVDIDDYLDNKRDPMTFGHRMKLQAAVDFVKPKFVIHGHYHQRFVARGEHPEGKFTNIGLASNESPLSMQCMVFDCDAMTHDFSARFNRWVEM